MLGNSIHLDTKFSKENFSPEDEEVCKRFGKVFFSLLRSGQLTDAKNLCTDLNQISWSAFLYIREILKNPKMSPLNSKNENFYLTQSRLFFKQTARGLISLVIN